MTGNRNRGWRRECSRARRHTTGSWSSPCWRVLVAGLLALGPRATLRMPWPWLGALPALVVAAPQIAYQAGHEQVATAYHRAGDADILTSNYGEAGAVARFGPAYGLPAPVSGHNALADLTMPTRDRVLVLGGAWCDLAPAFARCERVGELDNGVDVDNEEQGEELTLCAGRTPPWADLWPHL
ncbi:hypothetical protein [Nostocoides australiense]